MALVQHAKGCGLRQGRLDHSGRKKRSANYQRDIFRGNHDFVPLTFPLVVLRLPVQGVVVVNSDELFDAVISIEKLPQELRDGIADDGLDRSYDAERHVMHNKADAYRVSTRQTYSAHVFQCLT